MICATPQTSNVNDDCTPVRKQLRDSNNDPDLDSTTTEKNRYLNFLSVIMKRKFSFLVQLDNTFCCLKYLFLKVFEGILIVRSYIFASVIFDVAWFYVS